MLQKCTLVQKLCDEIIISPNDLMNTFYIQISGTTKAILYTPINKVSNEEALNLLSGKAY